MSDTNWFVYLVSIFWAGAAFALVYYVAEFLQSAVKSYEQKYSAETARHLDDMFLALPAAQIFYLALGTAAAAFAIAFFLIGGLGSVEQFVVGCCAGLAAAAVGFLIPKRVLKIMKQRRVKKFNEQLVDALATMSNSLRAGFSIVQAFEMVIKEGRRPISEEFGLFMHQHRLGMKFEDALGELGKRMESADLDLMIAAIETARQTGGNLTEVFDRLAETIRERMRVEGKIQSLTALGRMQGRIVGLVVPVVLVLGMWWFNPRLMGDFIGWTMGPIPLGILIFIGLGLWVSIGFWFIRKIVEIDV
jgi:tight adherence protein B